MPGNNRQQYYTPEEPTGWSDFAPDPGPATGGDAVTSPTADQGVPSGDAAAAPTTPLALASSAGGGSPGVGKVTQSDRILATRTMPLTAVGPYVEFLRAQSVKIIRMSDDTKRVFVEFDNSEKFELFLDQFFTPGGMFNSTRWTADGETTVTVQFGAKFSG